MTGPIESVDLPIGEVPVDIRIGGSGLEGTDSVKDEFDTGQILARVELGVTADALEKRAVDDRNATLSQYAEAFHHLKQAIADGVITLTVTLEGDEVDRSSGAVPHVWSGASPQAIVQSSSSTVSPSPASLASAEASLASACVTEDRLSGHSTTISQDAKGAEAAPVARRATIAMRSKALDADLRFRSVIVSLDAVPGNQVEGISPLYHVMGVDESDSMSAVIAISTKCEPSALADIFDSLERAHEGTIKLSLLDFEGHVSGEAGSPSGASESGTNASCEDSNPFMPIDQIRHEAAVLAPWLDMDPDARLAGDPVSYLLAMAPDGARVGRLSERWIVGDTQ
jgi:7,8-dihydro-6-hydroxymethylpterin-pyrophosphokinase